MQKDKNTDLEDRTMDWEKVSEKIRHEEPVKLRFPQIYNYCLHLMEKKTLQTAFNPIEYLSKDAVFRAETGLNETRLNYDPRNHTIEISSFKLAFGPVSIEERSTKYSIEVLSDYYSRSVLGFSLAGKFHGFYLKLGAAYSTKPEWHGIIP